MAAAQPADPYASPVVPPPGPRFATPLPSDGFVPLNAGGWPMGASFEDLRYLHECSFGELGAAKPGAPIPCRPPISDQPAHIFWGIDWTTGIAFTTSDAQARTTGGAHGLGVDVQYAATRSVLVGARYELMGFGVPTLRGRDAAAGISHQVFALAKQRLWLDETARTSWTLGAGIGYAFRDESLGGFAPVARLSISRDTGLPVGDNVAGIAQLELAFEQALDGERAASVLGAVRIGWEHGIREPLNLGGSPPEVGPGHWTLSGDVRLGPALGLGTSFGLRIARPLSLETTAMFQFGRSDGVKEHGFEGAQWSLASGFRVMLPSPSVMPLYVQAQVGPAWVGHEAGREVRWIGDGELGFRYPGCRLGVDLAGYVRTDVQDGMKITDGGFVMRVAVGSGPGALGGRGSWQTGCRGYSSPQFASPPPPPPPPPVAPPPAPVVVAAPVIVVAPPPVVVVEVKPVVIDLDLGAALFGGAVRVNLDPRLLPLAALRAGGWVQIDLTGPLDALAPFQAHLGAALSRNGARVDAWTTRSTDTSVIHARFTIWPPGARHP